MKIMSRLLPSFHLSLFSLVATVFICMACPCETAASDVDSIIFKGADYLYKEQLEKAEKCFKEAVRLDPKNEFAHNKLGIVYAKQRRFDDAFKEFLLVTKLDGKNTFAHKMIGILYLKKDEMNLAFDRFNSIVKIDQNNADAYYFLGAIYNFRHNQAKAIEYLKKARDAASHEADTHYRLAKAFHNVDMVENAMLEYQRALEIKPAYTKALNETGWIHYNRGDPDKAISAWKKTLKINNRDRDAVYNIAKAYNDLALNAAKSGNRAEAIKYWKKVISINPGNKAAKYYLNRYR
jgi:tetratricopeptide (TPR) repeat protein